MRILPILMAAAIGTFATTAAFSQGAASNQPANQPTTTEAAHGKMDDGKMMKKMTKKQKKMKKHQM
jgi:hypothetical protein